MKDKIILITGAAGSLGSVAAKALALAGAQLILLDKAIDRLEKLHDEIVQQGSLQPALYPIDLAKALPADYQELRAILADQFKRLDGLLHSAAELPILGPLSDADPNVWQRILQVNLTSACWLTQAALPLLNQAENASIVFTTDSQARLNHAYWGAYGVAKSGLESLGLMLAEELEAAGKIRVNLFSPGPVRSTIRKRSHPGEHQDQCMPAEALADRYIYMLGSASIGITGQIIQGSTSN